MKISLSILIFLILFSCKTEKEKSVGQSNKWKEHFSKYKYEFNNLFEYVHENYVSSEEHAKKLRIILRNCKIDQKVMPLEICDERAIDYMEELGVQEIAVERELSCKEVNGLNVIFLTMAEPENPVVIYIYDYCSTEYASENSSIKYWPLDEHWALQFEY